MKSGAFKGGFSIIELMVTIVIMGILAAVAVPKLFGFMAKAKAAEVYSAAGTYIALQDAFNTEHQSVIGSWGEIGYVMPSTSNFKYFEGSTEGGIKVSSTVTVDEGLSVAWKATNKVTFNDCPEGSIWQIDIEKSKDYNLVYQVGITNGPAGNCGVLTSNFGALSTVNHIALSL